MRIPPQGDGWLDFDLREVMDAVGPHEDLSWHLSGGWIVFRDDDPSQQLVRLAQGAESDSGVGLTWPDMRQLSEECLQIIDGRFVGRRDGHPVLSIAAVDSSYWIVWTAEERVADLLRRAFRGVEDYPEPSPA
ncbi:MAG: hypothetical protein M3256_26230 [Actinomycetota bacterium]|nr:hypothetical protein [Actinomycetota bacterium]